MVYSYLTLWLIFYLSFYQWFTHKNMYKVHLFAACLFACAACDKTPEPDVVNPVVNPVKIQYTMPDEAEPHEGTWLQWPHSYQYGNTYRNSLDATWVAMTQHLVSSEKVHLVVYDETEKNRVLNLLTAANVPQTNIDFNIFPTDDVWARDNAPIFVKDSSGKILMEDWGFNGWGKKAAYQKCDVIPEKIATVLGIPRVDLNSTMINEGGSVEIDGHGTLMACKSSILNSNRNPNMTQKQAEDIFTKNLGVTHFVWLNGKAGLEITDMHIDGFARFAHGTTLVTMSEADLLEWQVPQADITTLFAAKNKSGTAYNLLKLPLTRNNVVTTAGKNLGYKGSYINYYIANTKILVPNYNDPNDVVANQMIQNLYPNRTVVGVDVRNLYENGGMIHCVTQQQPR
jgi:agmatine deiminase